MENQGRRHNLTLWIASLVASITMLVIANSILRYAPSAPGGTLFDAIGAFLPYGLMIAVAVYYFLKSDVSPSRPRLSGTGFSILHLVRYILLMIGGMLLSMAPFLLVFWGIALSGINLGQSGAGTTVLPYAPSNPIQVSSPSFDEWAFLVILSVAFVFAVLLLATIVRGKEDHVEEIIDEGLGRTISTSYGSTDGFPDDHHRRAILSYYAKSRDHMTNQGVPLTEAMTPREFEKNVITSLSEAGESFTPLTHLFEEARFSTHTMGASEKSEARKHYENLKTINLKGRKRLE